MTEPSTDRLLGEIVESIRGLREDVAEVRLEIRADRAITQLALQEHEKKLNSHESWFARIASVSAVVGSVVTLAAEWAFRKLFA